MTATLRIQDASGRTVFQIAVHDGCSFALPDLFASNFYGEVYTWEIVTLTSSAEQSPP